MYEFWKKASPIKGKKTPESSRALKVIVVILEAKTDNRNNESLFADEKPKANNGFDPALNTKGKRDKATQILKVGAVERGQSAQCAERQI